MFVISIIAAAFLVGSITTVIALLRVGIAREESGQSILDRPPTRSAAATRSIVGLHVRAPRHVTQPDHAADRAETESAQRPANRSGR